MTSELFPLRLNELFYERVVKRKNILTMPAISLTAGPAATYPETLQLAQAHAVYYLSPPQGSPTEMLLRATLVLLHLEVLTIVLSEPS